MCHARRICVISVIGVLLLIVGMPASGLADDVGHASVVVDDEASDVTDIEEDDDIEHPDADDVSPGEHERDVEGDDELSPGCQERVTSSTAESGGPQCTRVGYGVSYRADSDTCVRTFQNNVCNFSTPFDSIRECLATCGQQDSQDLQRDGDESATDNPVPWSVRGVPDQQELSECPERDATTRRSGSSDRLECSRKMCVRFPPHEDPCYFSTPYDFDWIIDLDASDREVIPLFE